ncbi:hypothetical protein O3S80_03300 [Streptomyces sp. Lzd4kr]|nr:hypothetical protein [Streptomyces sp. Lzd4kr]
MEFAHVPALRSVTSEYRLSCEMSNGHSQTSDHAAKARTVRPKICGQPVMSPSRQANHMSNSTGWEQSMRRMKKLTTIQRALFASFAAGTLVAAIPTSAQAAGWEGSGGGCRSGRISILVPDPTSPVPHFNQSIFDVTSCISSSGGNINVDAYVNTLKGGLGCQTKLYYHGPRGWSDGYTPKYTNGYARYPWPAGGVVGDYYTQLKVKCFATSNTVESPVQHLAWR